MKVRAVFPYSKVRSRGGLVAIVTAVLSVTSLTGCDVIEQMEKAQLSKVCESMKSKNDNQPRFTAQAVRYIERRVATDTPPNWKKAGSEILCGVTCRDLVGYKGITVYVNVTDDIYAKYSAFYNKIPNKKRPYEDIGIRSPGIYAYYPADLNACEGYTKPVFNVNGNQYPFKFCVSSRLVTSSDELLAVERMPLVLDDSDVSWLSLPPDAPSGFSWTSLVRVFDHDGAEVIRGIDGHVYKGLGDYRCSGDSRDFSELVLFKG